MRPPASLVRLVRVAALIRAYAPLVDLAITRTCLVPVAVLHVPKDILVPFQTPLPFFVLLGTTQLQLPDLASRVREGHTPGHTSLDRAPPALLARSVLHNPLHLLLVQLGRIL